jgi:hypothetical protein
MATQTAAQREQEATRVTVPEIVTGPVAGALVGYGVFAIALVVIGALFAEERLSLPEQSWKDLGLGASVLAGVILFFGYLYGGAGQRGIPLGVGVFLAGLALAALAGWAVSSGTSGDERETAAQTLRALGAPGGSDDWADIGTTAGVSSVAGMLLGSMAGGALAEHRTRAAATRGGSKRRKK